MNLYVVYLKQIYCESTMWACLLSRFSHVQLFETLWTVACQAPLSMGFSRQEYWSGLPLPSLVYLPNPGIKRTSLLSPTLADGFFTTSSTWEAQKPIRVQYYITHCSITYGTQANFFRPTNKFDLRKHSWNGVELIRMSEAYCTVLS